MRIFNALSKMRSNDQRESFSIKKNTNPSYDVFQDFQRASVAHSPSRCELRSLQLAPAEGDKQAGVLMPLLVVSNYSCNSHPLQDTSTQGFSTSHASARGKELYLQLAPASGNRSGSQLDIK